MKTLKSIFFFIILFSYLESYSQSKKDSLIIFIGQLISIKKEPNNTTIEIDTIIVGKDTSYEEVISASMDAKFIANYKIIKLMNGYYDADTIEFIVYDHYGIPKFTTYKTVLLFVKPYESKFMHEKYQFYPLFLTKTNRWASPYSVYDYTHLPKDSITVKPEKIFYKKKVWFSIKKLPKDYYTYRYPKPYYKIKKDKAIAKYGNYIEDLILLKQQTILKTRGYY